MFQFVKDIQTLLCGEINQENQTMKLIDINNPIIWQKPQMESEWICTKQSIASLPEKQSIVLGEESFDVSGLKAVKTTIKKYIFRPQNFNEFIGQSTNKEKIAVALKRIQAGMKVHFLFNAAPGTGKTSFARIIANMLDAHFVECIGKQLTTETLKQYMNEFYDSDKPYNILFVDEIETAPYNVCKLLNPLLEDFAIAGIQVKPFILIGCTINKNMLITRGNNDMIDRITDQIYFEQYSAEDIYKILVQYHKKMYSQYKISDEDIKLLSQNCKFCPRIAIPMLENLVILGDAKKVLYNEGIVRNGLTHIDIKILEILQGRYPKTYGASTLSQRVGINDKDYIAIYEPFLNQQGYIERIPMRKISEKGIKFLEEIKKGE